MAIFPTTLTPEEQAEFEQLSPRPLDPINDLSEDDLFQLAVEKQFDPVEWAAANKQRLDNTAAAKLAEVNARIRARGFELSDLPSVKEAFKGVAHAVKGGLKALKQTASGYTIPLVDIATLGKYTPELADIGEKQAAEVSAAVETGGLGLVDLGRKALRKAGEFIGAKTPWDKMTPGQKQQEFFNELGRFETTQQAATGKGAFTQAIAGETIEDLKSKGVTLDETAIQEMAAGDPISFIAFGGAFNVLGKGGKLLARAPSAEAAQAAASSIAQQVATKAGAVPIVAAGKGLEAAGVVTKFAGRAAPITGAVVGAVKGGPFGALAGIGGGMATKAIARRTSEALKEAGKAVTTGGKEIFAGGPVASRYAEVARSLLKAAPPFAAEVAKGAGLDLALAAATSETPAETEAAAAFGTALGLLKGGVRAAKIGVQGQLLTPRTWGTAEQSAPYGTHALLDAAHQRSVQSLDPAQTQRANSIREFLKGLPGNLEAYLLPDAAALEQVLVQDFTRRNKVAPNEAQLAEIRQVAQQKGMFTADLIDDRGRPQRAVLLNQADAAPHEAFHSIQDVLGEGANRVVDTLVFNEYAPQWEQLGENYARRLAGENYEALKQQGQNWRQIIQDFTKWNDADIYIARELAAENFDAAFRASDPNFGQGNTLPEKLARVVARTMSFFGMEPFEGAPPTAGLQIEPRFKVTEAAREAVKALRPEPAAARPKPEAPAPARPTRTPPPISAEERQAEAARTAELAIRNPDQAEILRKISQAIASGVGLKVEYRSAPGEPAGDPGVSRPERRVAVEAFRDMPEDVRVLWEKLNFPDKVEQTKKGLQIVGWSPENLAANAQRTAKFIAELSEAKPEAAQLSPYPVDPATKTFTPEGWQQLFNDVQTFVRNQQAGGRGTGEPLILPARAAEMRVRVPEARPEQLAPLEQNKADFINLLFNTMLPETVRISRKGGVPANIVAQEIAAVTAPERIVEPGRPRGVSPETQAPMEFAGFPGRRIMELNPLRAQLERIASEAKVKPPQLVEVNQRLNLEHIADVNLAPEAPTVRAVTDILRAGFLPETGREAREWRVRGQRGGLRDEVTIKADTTQEAQRLAEQQGFRVERVSPLGEPAALRLGLLPEEAPKPAMERLQKMTSDEWRELTRTYQGKFGKGLTAWAFELGSRARTPEDLAALRSTYDVMTAAGREAMAAGQFEKGMEFITRAQAAHEAYQAATGVNFSGKRQGADFIRERIDPNYKEPMPSEAVTEPAAAATPTEAATLKMAALPAEKKAKFKLKLGQPGTESKMWVLPSGEPIPLGGKWHHDWLAEHREEMKKRFKMEVPEFPGQDVEGVREDALKRGFVRINYLKGSGTLVVEARARDWRHQKDSVEQIVESNLDNIDNITIHLLDDSVKKVVDSDSERLFRYDEDTEKLANIPFITKEEARFQFSPSAEMYPVVQRVLEQREKKTQALPKDFDLFKFSREMEKIKREEVSGQTFTSQGEVWAAPPEKVDIVSLASINIPKKDLTEDSFSKAVTPYDALLDQPNVVAGVFAFEREGVPMVSIDINAAVPQEFRENTLRFAKENDQIAIWDASKSEEVPSGGSGDSKLKSPSQILQAVSLLSAGKPVDVKALAEKKEPGFQFLPPPEGFEGEYVTRAAVKMPDGKIFKGTYHADARERAIATGRYDNVEEISYEDGFVTSKNRFVSREEAFDIAEVAKQVSEKETRERVDFLEASGPGMLEAVTFEAARQFLPPPKGFKGEYVTKAAVKLPNEKVFTGQFHADAIEKALRSAPFGEIKGEDMIDGFVTNKGRFVSREEAFDIAEAAKQISAKEYEKAELEEFGFTTREDYLEMAGPGAAKKLEELVPLESYTFETTRRFLPKEEQTALPGMGAAPEFKRTYTLNQRELRERFPEAVIPRTRGDVVESNIVGSPLYKQAKSRSEAVDLFADKLVEFAKEWKDRPEYKAGLRWYEDFTPALKKQFGKDAPLFAELLAATSPQTAASVNFGYAFDALKSLKAGRFDKIVPKFNEGLAHLDKGSWEKIFTREQNAGRIPSEVKPTEAAFMAYWIDRHNLKPRQANGKLYGVHSLNVLRVLARKWLNEKTGPKTSNFVKNLLGTGDEATIDLWADRTMRRVGYSDFKDRWRILPENIAPVSREDFDFSQAAFRKAAEQLGVKPSSLQAALWFAEKKLWSDSGWAELDLGDFREEMKLVPLREAGFRQRLEEEKRAKRVKPKVQEELELSIEPRQRR